MSRRNSNGKPNRTQRLKLERQIQYNKNTESMMQTMDTHTRVSRTSTVDGVRRFPYPQSQETSSSQARLVLDVRGMRDSTAVSRQNASEHSGGGDQSSLKPKRSWFYCSLTQVRVFCGEKSRLFMLLSGRARESHYFFLTSPRRALYISLASGVAFGVFLTAMTFSLFDQGVSAKSEPEHISGGVVLSQTEPSTEVFGATGGDDVFLEYFGEAAEEEYQTKITEMVKGYPVEEMLPYIFTKDRTVAAFLIGIAKKESNWGKRVPVLDGQDCFNYWGYRGVRRLMGTGGHTCFNSRKDAVDTVAKRIEKLVYSEKLDTPEKMILWKCGFSCAGHSRESVKKWISDVSLYFSQIDERGEE